jgi:hypothetical protein
MASTTQTHWGRRWLINSLLLVFSIVALFVADSVYRQAESSQLLFEGEAGDILLAESFDIPESSLWQTYAGRLSADISGGVMTMRIDNASDTAYSASAPLFNDFDVSVQASAIDGPIDNGFGLVFRLQEPVERCDMPLLALCALAEVDILNVGLRLLFPAQATTPSGYYMFLISSDGYYSVWKAEDIFGETQASMVSTWIPSDVILQGLDAENTIRVQGIGDAFRFFINEQAVALCIPDAEGAESTYFMDTCVDGQMVTTWRDATFGDGKNWCSGKQYSDGGTGVTVAFDQVIVTQPKPDADNDTVQAIPNTPFSSN